MERLGGAAYGPPGGRGKSAAKQAQRFAQEAKAAAEAAKKSSKDALGKVQPKTLPMTPKGPPPGAGRGPGASGARGAPNAPVQRITNKLNDADSGLFRPRALDGVEIRDGKFYVRSNPLHTTHGETMEFVVGMDGRVVLGYRHQHLAKVAGDKMNVQAAGTITIKNGKVTVIDNNSGHFLPTEAETLNYAQVLRNAGVDLKGAKLRIWAADPAAPGGARVVREVILD